MKNNSNAFHREFAFLEHGTAMAPQTAMTIPMNQQVAVKLIVPQTFTNAKTPNVSSRHTFAMEKTIAVMALMREKNMLVVVQRSVVPPANGNVQKLQSDALTSLQCVMVNSIVQMVLMKEKVAI